VRLVRPRSASNANVLNERPWSVKRQSLPESKRKLSRNFWLRRTNSPEASF
jgi:hypothetical protein